MPEHEGLYEVSSLGRVRSLDRTIIYSNGNCHQVAGKMLRFKRRKYLHVSVSKGDIETYWVVSRLVCWTFHGPPPTERHQAAHLDGNERNNTKENLVWATRKENESHKVGHGTHNRGERNHRSRLSEAEVKAIRAASGRCTQAELARHYRTSPSLISHIHRGKLWKHV